MRHIQGICREARHITWTLHKSDGSKHPQFSYEGERELLPRALGMDAPIGQDGQSWFIDGWSDPGERWSTAQKAASAFFKAEAINHLLQIFPGAAPPKSGLIGRHSHLTNIVGE